MRHLIPIPARYWLAYAVLIAALVAILPQRALAVAVEGSPYVRFDGVSVALIEGLRIRGVFAINLVLEIDDQGEKERIERQKPRLADAYLRNLQRYATARVTVDRPIDIETLTRFLEQVTEATIGKTSARTLVISATTWER